MKAAVMDKELLVRMPKFLYKKAKELCKGEYKSMSSLVRELILEKLDDSFTAEELRTIEKARKQFHKGEGVNWKEMKRG